MSARSPAAFIRVVVGSLLVAIAVIGFLGVIFTARDASATTRAVQDGSRADVIRAIAGGPGEPATSQLVTLAARPPAGQRFALTSAADVDPGQHEFLSQVLRFALFPATLDADPSRADYTIHARMSGDALTLAVRVPGSWKAAPRP